MLFKESVEKMIGQTMDELNKPAIDELWVGKCVEYFFTEVSDKLCEHAGLTKCQTC